jgi:hypothetical protein
MMARPRSAGRARGAPIVLGVAGAGVVALIFVAANLSLAAPSAIRTPPEVVPVSPVVRSPPTGSTGGQLPYAQAPAVPPASLSPTTRAPSGRFGLGLLIADRGNGRLLIVNDVHQVLWAFPKAASLPNGQHFAADDAFLSPDGKTIVANDEAHQVIDRIDIVSRRVVWQYGHYDRPGSAGGYLHTPDDAYPLANGDIVVADIRNCRILEIGPSKRIVRQWGHTGVCRHDPPRSFDNPNGDTPLAGGGLLITEIGGSRVVRISPTGHVVFDIHVPVRYPSDAHLDGAGNVLVVDYSNPGTVLRVSPKGRVLWRYGPSGGAGRLDHPSLAIGLPDGTIALNDDFRDRVVVLDPGTGRIVWQYGRTDAGGRSAGRLFIPDGIDVVPVGTGL